MKAWNNGQLRELSAEEIAVIEADRKEWNDAKPTRQLAEIRKIRNRKLSETDYLGVSDNTMSSDWIAKRKSWRDIPQDYTTEAKYDELLEKKDDGSLKHSIWEKP